jgi:hypothetical protein
MQLFLIDFTNPENYEVQGEEKLYLAVVSVPPTASIEYSGAMGRYNGVHIDGNIDNYTVIHEFTLNLKHTWKRYLHDAISNHSELVNFWRDEDGSISGSEYTVATMHALSEFAIALKCEGVHWCYA